MDDDGGLGIRNWGYYEPSLKGNLGLQLMSSVADRDTKHFLSGRDSAIMIGANGAFLHRHCTVPGSPLPMEFVRNNWINHRDKVLDVLPGNPNFTVLSEPSGPPSLQIPQPLPDLENGVQVESSKKDAPLKKRPNGRACKPTTKTKKTKRTVESNCSVTREKLVKKNTNMGVLINGIDLDMSGIPIPVCSCTGTPQQCYRWGCGGWQSACCTTSMSMYPLPMSMKRRSARIAGRKMSQGAFKKVLEKLAGEGHDFSNPIDLRTHWAKHGTNKFVTIK
eukprot:TRINITY_DN3671_c0_g2_i1.p1 TRINITY_DN3671_c0_g2~~TRINITY_DN3671_c0_g2_i1.p1  ORF type:complete len:277 (-),score=21.14 TRINITY_DN3671_c0_g2_i1:213-1043(-)